MTMYIQQRNIEIDIMKGIAILCVMIGHVDWYPNIIGRVIYSFHMPLFFLISGYFAKTCNDYRGTFVSFFAKNAKQLLIPYAVVACICCMSSLVSGWNLFIHNLLRYVCALDHVWKNSLFDKQITPVWFLLALFWGRTFFILLSKTGKWFIPLCISLSLLIVLLHPYIVTPFGIGHGLESLVFLIIGYLYRMYNVPTIVKILIVICWPISIFLGGMDFFAYKYMCLPFNILGACGGTIVVYYVARNIKNTFISSFLAWCGRNSMTILCAHVVESSIPIIPMLANMMPVKVCSAVIDETRHSITLLGVLGYNKMKAILNGH